MTLGKGRILSTRWKGQTISEKVKKKIGCINSKYFFVYQTCPRVNNKPQLEQDTDNHNIYINC